MPATTGDLYTLIDLKHKTRSVCKNESNETLSNLLLELNYMLELDAQQILIKIGVKKQNSLNPSNLTDALQFIIHPP